MSWSSPHCTPEAIEEIKTLGLTALPHEACGIILHDPDSPSGCKVIQLDNLAKEPEHAFVISGEQIRDGFQRYLAELSARPNALALSRGMDLERQAYSKASHPSRKPRSEYKTHPLNSIQELPDAHAADLPIGEGAVMVVDRDLLWSLGFVCWHTHPSGAVGPSERDLTVRRALATALPITRFRSLVVSLPGGEGVVY